MNEPIEFKIAKEIAEILGVQHPELEQFRKPWINILFLTMAEKIKHLENEVEVLKQGK